MRFARVANADDREGTVGYRAAGSPGTQKYAMTELGPDLAGAVVLVP